MDKIEITFVVNLHREGRLSIPSLESAQAAVAFANDVGVSAELLIVSDNPDSTTLSVAERFAGCARLELASVKDLGAARNFSVCNASGRYVAFMDGDDLCCRNWLVAAHAEAESYSGDCVVHPKFNLFFGRNYPRYFWIHPDMRKDKLNLSRLVVENLWTSSVFAKKTVFTRYPYIRNNIKDGLGYEDWVFNVETAFSGVQHIVAPDTILFIRRNKEASLLVASGSNAAMPDFGRAFERSPDLLKNIRCHLGGL